MDVMAGTRLAWRAAGLPAEQYQTTGAGAERAYPNLIHFNEVDKGGHFAAWEEPELFSTEVRAAFRSLRNGGTS
jgi:pimeloyl-ACP methyl ester carboxylesterase